MQSAGLLLYRHKVGIVQVFLVHPGGPFWAKKDLGAWSIPKGEFAPDEDPLTAARREFTEETGFTVAGDFRPLPPIKQKGGKVVHAFAIEADVDAEQVRSNTFTFQGRTYPEVDRAGWFTIEEAAQKILPSQVPLLDQFRKPNPIPKPTT